MSKKEQLPPDVRQDIADTVKRMLVDGSAVEAAKALSAFMSRQKEVGVLVALAEMEDRTARISMAQALRAVYEKKKQGDTRCSD